MNNPGLVNIMILVVFLAVVYFLMIRPAKKKEKAVNDMRAGLRVGDHIVTIGGIYGKIIKTKEETVVIQVGADKTKIEIAKWGIGQVLETAPAKDKDESVKKSKPRRLGADKDKEKEKQAESNTETPKEEAVETPDDAIAKAGEDITM